MNINFLRRLIGSHSESEEPVNPEIALIIQELDTWLSREFELLDDGIGERATDVSGVLRGFAQRCQKVALVGSCRREKQVPGDVDVLYVPKNNLQVVEFLEQTADNEQEITRDGQAWKCTIDGRHVDFIESTIGGWGMDTIIFTGSREFNERMLRHAQRRGYEINKNRPALTRSGGYTSCVVPAFAGWPEDKILAHLGLGEFLDPRTRNGPVDTQELKTP
jgi:DNA polymerase/3'-5' exonuclease PolX